MDLQAEFRNLWTRLGYQGNCESEWFRREERYSQPWRYYHTLAHIEHVVQELTPVLGKLVRPDEVLWSAIDHDVELRPAINGKPVKSNELDSALFSLRTIVNANGSHDTAVRVALAIIATDHKPRELSGDIKYLLDADMAILGQRWAVYGQYAFRDIPQEYLACSVTRKAFTVGRLAFLQRLREKPIYLTQYFSQLYEEMARLNIDHEIRILTEELQKQ